MGLDIRAYNKMKKIADIPNEEDEQEEYRLEFETDSTRIYVNSDFNVEGQIIDGYYEHEDYLSFRAGSYSGYNTWRNKLAVIAGYKSANEVWSKTEGPFFELIFFSDCEGVIGAAASEKLFNDFFSYEEKAKEELDEYDFEKYVNFKKAFELAKDDGGVVFS